MKVSRVTTQGRIVIPSNIRRRFGIKPGTRIYFAEYGNKIILEPITPMFYRNLRGSLKKHSCVELLIKERIKDNKQ
jgi:AbrB family looped-hinge helix DNA binding protein